MSLTSSQRKLVDEIKRHSTLADAHLLRLPLRRVRVADLADLVLQAPGGLVLHVILLPFDLGARVQHDVLHLVLHVLRPRCQPRDGVVVTNLLPAMTLRRLRRFAVF